MIDFHSHILPGVDDGSQSVQESLALLAQLKAQQVSHVCATPHFYIQNHTPERFLQKRSAAFEALRSELPDDAPHILLGAEVYYYAGISHMKELPQLCLEGTRILLLEMPMCAWTDSMVHEVMELNCSGNIAVLLAHVERYLAKQRPGTLERLLRQDVLLQVNADSFTERHARRKAVKLLREGKVAAVGSDCHNTSGRPPRMDAFAAVVQQKLGERFLSSFTDAQYRFMEEYACVRS